MNSLKAYLGSLTLDTTQKKTILTLLQSELDFGLSVEGLEEMSANQIDELWQWLVVGDDDQRTGHIQAISKKITTSKKTIETLEKKLQMQMIEFEEAVDRAGEDDVEDLLYNL